MQIILRSGIAEELIKKSRFIGIASACHSEREAMALLQQCYQQHPHANHIVFAYRIQTPEQFLCKFHDAGEPSGTAGKPIFQHLEGKQLMNAIIIVIRYFGGIKLGAGGLTRAYSGAAKMALEAAEIGEFVPMSEAVLDLDYRQMQLLEYQLKKLDGAIVAQDFAEKVRVKVRLPSVNLPVLQAAMSERG